MVPGTAPWSRPVQHSRMGGMARGHRRRVDHHHAHTPHPRQGHPTRHKTCKPGEKTDDKLQSARQRHGDEIRNLQPLPRADPRRIPDSRASYALQPLDLLDRWQGGRSNPRPVLRPGATLHGAGGVLELLFQSSPGFEAGRYAVLGGAIGGGKREFQSSPGFEAGRYGHLSKPLPGGHFRACFREPVKFSLSAFISAFINSPKPLIYLVREPPREIALATGSRSG